MALLLFGIDQSIESEGHDREVLTLPGMQSELIGQVLAAQPNSVLVLINGGQLAIEKEKVWLLPRRFLWMYLRNDI